MKVNRKMFIIISIVLSLMLIMQSTVLATTISDDVIKTVQLSDGTSVEVHSNPYYCDFTELEYRIILKMQEKATEIGFDIENDTEYQKYEKLQYEWLADSYHNALDAKQVDIILDRIDHVALMLQEGVQNGAGGDNVISEGFFKGLTADEKHSLLIEVLGIYLPNELEKINIYHYNEYGITPSIYRSIPFLTYACKSNVVSNGNYIINDITESGTNTKPEFAEYFEGDYFVKRITSYPNEASLNASITVTIKDANWYEKFDSVYFIGNDGIVEKLDASFLGSSNSISFEIDEFGYIAYGKGKASAEVHNVSPAPENKEDIAKPDGNEADLSGKTEAPQTADTNQLMMYICIMGVSFLFLSMTRKKE